MCIRESLFWMDSSMSFDKCTQSCDHDLVIGRFCPHPQSFLLLHSLPHRYPQMATEWFSVPTVLPFTECYENGIIRATAF